MSDARWPHQFAAVIVGGGSGMRLGQPEKVLVPLQGKPLLDYSIDCFATHPGCAEIVVVLGSHTITKQDEIASRFAGVRLTFVLGGPTRAASVVAGLHALRDFSGLVAVHDAARPFVTRRLVTELLEAAKRYGAALPTIPITDTLHQIKSGRLVGEPIDRTTLCAGQTPQIALREWLELSLHQNSEATDEASALAASGYSVAGVPGDPDNIKITWPEDLERAELIAKRRLART